MKKIYLTILLIVFAVSFAAAQMPYAIIKGHVFNNDTRSPVAGQTMIISVDSLNSTDYRNKVVTNDAGFYTDSIKFNPGSTHIEITVSTYGCNGSLITSTAYSYPNSADVTLDFLICNGQSKECVAKFKTQFVSNDMLSLYFMDSSHSSYGSDLFKYFWDFGDGTTSTDQSLVHTFDKTGVYNVCLHIVNSNDSLCSSSYCSSVSVGYPDSGACRNYFIYYSDSSKNEYVFEGYGLNGQADSWYWEFGDGTSATGQRVKHSYATTNANYKVCLTTTAANPDGTICTSNTCQDLSTYVPSTCESSFWCQADSSGSAYTFQGWTMNNQATSWKWDFGDGTSASGQTVTHSFPDKSDIYRVCLTTTGVNSDSTNCLYSNCQDIYIYKPSPCESSFWYQPDSTGSGFTFEGYDKYNQIISWNWDFSDGTTATGQKVSHSFNSSNNTTGSFYACLTTTGINAAGDSCTFRSCQDIYINPPSPCENYFKSYSEDGSKYTFSGTVASGAQANYYWDFGDGSTGTGQVVTHTFEGKYTVFNVCLTTLVPFPDVSGFNECKSISCQAINIGNDSSMCRAVFSAIPDSQENTYYFQNHSQKKYSYTLWDFGDGSQSSKVDDIHTYASPGIYMACLTVIDSISNCIDQTCQEIWVDMIQSGCKASFYAFPPDSVANSASFMFINTSTESVYSNLKWSFGDGTGSTEFNPVHSYINPGNYTVCLTIWDSSGSCQSSYCTDIFAGKTTGDYTVSGIVLTGNKVADQGIVWLISPDNNYNAELVIDSTGIFNFTGVPYGKYFIYAMLTPGADDFFAYMPTYYSGSLSWQEATLIHTGEPNAWYSVNLIPSMKWSPGDATITGTIIWSGNGKSDANPAANVEVVLYNSSGDPIAYTFTNSDGVFEFNQLSYGEYMLQAEMPGKATQLIPVNLSENSSVINIDFRVNASEVYILGIDTPNNTKILAGNPYPNPVAENLYLDLNVPVSGTATIEVIDMQGRIIHRELSALANGNNRISIKTYNFVKGVYQLRIKSEGQKPVQRRFIR